MTLVLSWVLVVESEYGGRKDPLERPVHGHSA